MSLVGGNLEQLDGLQRSFTSEARAVEALVARISAVLEGTTWMGPGATAFREQFRGQFVPALHGLRTALDEQAGIVAGRRQAIAAATA